MNDRDPHVIEHTLSVKDHLFENLNLIFNFVTILNKVAERLCEQLWSKL